MKQQQIIGVIGGMGPQASVEFYRLLIEGAKQRYGVHNNDEYPEILIDSVPVPDFLADTEKMEIAAGMLEDRVRRLTKYGASMIAMACNTACMLTHRLQEQTHVPCISIIDEVVRVCVHHDTPVLLLASPTSLKLRLYQLQLARFSIPYVVPKRMDYKELEYIIRGVINGEERALLMHRLVKLTERFVKKKAIGGIVLGCTELPLVFPKKYRIPVYSSLSILADTVLKRYYTKEVV